MQIQKKISMRINQLDLNCLVYAMQQLPKTNDASTAMTLGTAQMLVDRIRAEFNHAPVCKRPKDL